MLSSFCYFFWWFVLSEQVTYKYELIIILINISGLLLGPVADLPVQCSTIDTTLLYKLIWSSAHLQILHVPVPLCQMASSIHEQFHLLFLEKAILFTCLREFWIHPRVICKSSVSSVNLFKQQGLKEPSRWLFPPSRSAHRLRAHSMKLPWTPRVMSLKQRVSEEIFLPL